MLKINRLSSVISSLALALPLMVTFSGSSEAIFNVTCDPGSRAFNPALCHTPGNPSQSKQSATQQPSWQGWLSLGGRYSDSVSPRPQAAQPNSKSNAANPKPKPPEKGGKHFAPHVKRTVTEFKDALRTYRDKCPSLFAAQNKIARGLAQVQRSYVSMRAELPSTTKLASTESAIDDKAEILGIKKQVIARIDADQKALEEALTQFDKIREWFGLCLKYRAKLARATHYMAGVADARVVLSINGPGKKSKSKPDAKAKSLEKAYRDSLKKGERDWRQWQSQAESQIAEVIASMKKDEASAKALEKKLLPSTATLAKATQATVKALEAIKKTPK